MLSHKLNQFEVEVRVGNTPITVPVVLSGDPSVSILSYLNCVYYVQVSVTKCLTLH